MVRTGLSVETRQPLLSRPARDKGWDRLTPHSQAMMFDQQWTQAAQVPKSHRSVTQVFSTEDEQLITPHY